MSTLSQRLWVLLENEAPTRVEIGIKPTIHRVNELVEATLFRNQREILEVIQHWPRRQFRIVEASLRLISWTSKELPRSDYKEEALRTRIAKLEDIVTVLVEDVNKLKSKPK